MNFIPSTNSNPRKNKRQERLWKLALVLLFGTAAAGLWTCQLRGDSGTLEVRLRDHREAIGDIARLEINVETLRLNPRAKLKSSLPGWKELRPSVQKIDLTKFTGKHSVLIFKGELESSRFEAIHLKLSNVEGTLKKSQGQALITNRIGPIRLAFSVREKESTQIVLDLVVLDMRDHPSGSYELHTKGYELYSDGKLIEKIPPG
jgi:hypothetical protein